MTREQFEHAIRAAGAILRTDSLLVIGSQALHGSFAEPLPLAATRSVEVDIAVPNDSDGRRADLLDGSIGEGSLFHETFGYYAQGVVEQTATLPDGWRSRLVRFETPGTNGVVAWCLDPADLWVSKAIAGRPKALEFCQSLVESGLVEASTIREQLARVSGLTGEKRSLVEARLAAWSGRHRNR